MFHGGVDAAIFRVVLGHGAGHADGRGARNEYQSDHRDSKGQFHGTPLDTGETGKRWSGLKAFVELGVNLYSRELDRSVGDQVDRLNINLHATGKSL
jgi:hypothetical protein